MVLNYLWIAFFVIAFVIALFRTIVFGDLTIWNDIMTATFGTAKTAFEITLGLTGVLTLWMGLMKIGERSGVIAFFSKLVSPLFCRLFPDLPKDSPALGSIFMNLSANMLGLDNAATPLGLKAMQEMQDVNPKKDTASNPMIMFLVLNTAGMTLIPVGVMVYRSQLGAANPTDIFIPILIATYFSTLVGIIAVAIKQKLNLFNRVVIGSLGGMFLLIMGIMLFFANLPHDKVSIYSSFAANFVLFSIITGFIIAGLRKQLNVYDVFIEGAKDGFKTVVGIIPYLVGILVSISVFRASGAMEYFMSGLTQAIGYFGLNTDFVPALPVAFMKPLSGSGARGLMVDAINTYGVDSFVGRVASTIQGSTDTTFYVLAVYFGSVKISKTRNAAGLGLLADAAGFTAAIIVSYLFFS